MFIFLLFSYGAVVGAGGLPVCGSEMRKQWLAWNCGLTCGGGSRFSAREINCRTGLARETVGRSLAAESQPHYSRASGTLVKACRELTP